jgi:F-type H+-transporting ATPase subunit gamma
MNLCKAVAAKLGKDGIAQADLYVIGRKGGDFFRRTSHKIVEYHTELTAAEEQKVVRDMIATVSHRFLNGEVDRVHLAFNTYVSVISQRPTLNTLLPITPPEDAGGDEREVLFEPSAEEILQSLLEKYIQNQVYSALLETHAGEHAARMTAMDSATKNAGEMIDKLQLFYNRTRQAAITKELIEIISGAETL